MAISYRFEIVADVVVGNVVSGSTATIKISIIFNEISTVSEAQFCRWLCGGLTVRFKISIIIYEISTIKHDAI